MRRKDNQRNMTTNDIVLMSVETLLFIAQIVVCILFYNYLGLNLLMYCGWAILLIAFLLGWQARVAFEEKGKQDAGDNWLHTRTVVATGVYGVVRHPMYLAFALMSLTLVCLSQHWLNAVLGAAMVGLIYNDMCREERGNIEKFGDDYRQYMKRVPRVNVLLGMIRLAKRR
jgi:protein-S-isoprenylcysteine O-methyltransferase Ste14